MDEPIELQAIMEHTTSVVDETTYVTPVASRAEDNEYMKIDEVAERMTTSGTTIDTPTRNVDGVDVGKPSTDAFALRKVQIFCLVLLTMIVISSVTIGVLINMMMQRTDELQLKISELQNKPGVLTGTESANFQELQDKVIQLEKDKSFHTSLIQDHVSRIQDHRTRIAQLETETNANGDSIQKQSAIISKIETDKTQYEKSFHELNNTLEQLTIDFSASKEDIQPQQTRFREIESDIKLHQDNIQTLNETILRIKSDTSSNIAHSQSMMELLNSSITTLETNLTTQGITIHDHSLRLGEIETEMEPAIIIKDLNNSLLEQETKVKSLGVAVSNNLLNINQIHADVERTHNSLVNLTIVTNSIEIDIQSDSATIAENQRRISRVELDNNATDSLYQTMESRLTYLEDGLNCTWGNWTSFTSCSATCGDGIQYRERSLEGIDTENSRQWCARTETGFQTCNIQQCKPVNGGWGKWAPYSNCSRICDGGNQTRVRVCDNPEPAYGGAPCHGNKEETHTCNIDPCQDPAPEDCSRLTTGVRIDGVYNISPNKSLTESLPVYCEFSSDGAWTVIQKRYDGSVDFNRTWQEYKAGFGDVNGEYWLGNDAIHEITNRGTYRLKVRVTDWDNVTKLAFYTTFLISNESDGYRLTIDGYSGDAVMLLNIIMVGNSQQETTTKLTSNVLRSVAGLGGGLGGAAIPIQMVTTTTHRIPQSQLGFGGSIGMASDIPLKQQL